MPRVAGQISDSTAAQPDASPHPILGAFYRHADERSPMLTGLFDESAEHYDWINHVLSFGTGERYRADALRRSGLKSGMRVVDVACGTGVISELAAGIVGDASLVTSVDPSEGMRRIAKDKRGIEAVAGTAEDLPFDDRCADFMVMGYALRHVDNLHRAFAEFRRVLRPSGRLLVMEITAPSNRIGRSLARVYFRRLLPMIGGIVSRNPAVRQLWTYHWESIEQCVRPEAIREALEHAGFEGVGRHTALGLFSEYTARRANDAVL